MLTSIISRNGSLLLNIGPSPEGDWDPKAYESLAQISQWMKVNEEAVFESAADPSLPGTGQWVYTRKGNVVYAIYQSKENETTMPALVEIPFAPTDALKTISLLGSTQKLKAKKVAGLLQVAIPKSLSQLPPAKEAWVFKISMDGK
jgi:alpha-L-fucosidase